MCTYQGVEKNKLLNFICKTQFIRQAIEINTYIVGNNTAYAPVFSAKSFVLQYIVIFRGLGTCFVN